MKQILYLLTITAFAASCGTPKGITGNQVKQDTLNTVLLDTIPEKLIDSIQLTLSSKLILVRVDSMTDVQVNGKITLFSAPPDQKIFEIGTPCIIAKHKGEKPDYILSIQFEESDSAVLEFIPNKRGMYRINQENGSEVFYDGKEYICHFDTLIPFLIVDVDSIRGQLNKTVAKGMRIGNVGVSDDKADSAKAKMGAGDQVSTTLDLGWTTEGLGPGNVKIFWKPIISATQYTMRIYYYIDGGEQQYRDIDISPKNSTQSVVSLTRGATYTVVVGAYNSSNQLVVTETMQINL